MKENITLYNHFHNGDQFYSRILINCLKNNFEITYYHNQHLGLFIDLPEVREIKNIPNNFPIHQNYLDKKIVNTWIGQSNMVYVNTPSPGCSFDNYFRLCKEISNYYNIKLNSPIEYLPVINYVNLKDYNIISSEISELRKKFDRIVLISNGNVNSGQALNFDMSGIINDLSTSNKNVLFLVTQNLNLNIDNIINISNITRKTPDLLEIGLISTFCDIIIGRASGPFCFTHTKDNLMNPNKKFISFSNNRNEGVWFKESKAKQFWTNIYDKNHMFSIINEQIIN